MNLTEALNVALPELPAKTAARRYPRLHPKLVGRERVENGQPLVTCVISGKTWLYQFPPQQWQLLQLFDGERSYQEISDLFFDQTGIRYGQQEIRDMADNLDAMEFWYKTPLEENLSLKQKLHDHRSQRQQNKSKYGDVSHLQFSAWDPDEYFDRIYPYLKWVYSRWFTLLTIASFVLMSYIFFARWDEIGRDTLQFYNFTEKGFYDIAEFWLLACFVLFFHESAHGLTCKHYGGHVHRMGFHLIYFTPAFFTDVTEAWVYADRRERVATIVSGVWTEMIFCAVATPVWYVTPNGAWIHDAAYKIILITGVGVIFFNWNPLIKLDGYYLLTELFSLGELKEDSTLYLAGLVKRYLWRLPVEVPYIPKRRRLGYVIFAALSGLYSYSLLLFFARFIGNIFHHFSPEWAFIPATLVALRLFKTRIQTLVKFMKTVYLDKKERWRAWFTPQRRIAAGALLLFLFAVPWARESVQGRFILEPASFAVVRAAVPGIVSEVSADEGQAIAAGAPFIRLRNLQLESEAARSEADLRAATARARQAQLSYTDFAAEKQRQQMAAQEQLLRDELSRLDISSPVAGRVLSPRLRDRLGSYVTAGTELAQVGALDSMRARVYVPEFAVRKVSVGAAASLHLDSFFTSRSARVISLEPASSEIEAGLVHETPYKGIRPPAFYVATLLIPNPDGRLRPGMSGNARIYAGRRSLLGSASASVYEFIRRKLW